MIRIIGIGSPFGDDRAGLEVAARLALLTAPDLDVVFGDRPGVDLIELMRGADVAIVIDAVHSGAPAGTLHDLQLAAVPYARVRNASSHEFGVAEALALAQALGSLPARGRLIGVEVGAEPGKSTCDQLTAEVARALDDAVRRIQVWLDYFRSAAGTTSIAPRSGG